MQGLTSFTRHEMEVADYKALQLLRVLNINSTYEIGAVSDKAIMIKCDDGRWGGNGYKPLWIPKSILSDLGVDDRKEVSQYGTHIANLPDWFINKNIKLL